QGLRQGGEKMHGGNGKDYQSAHAEPVADQLQQLLERLEPGAGGAATGNIVDADQQQRGVELPWGLGLQQLGQLDGIQARAGSQWRAGGAVAGVSRGEPAGRRLAALCYPYAGAG